LHRLLRAGAEPIAIAARKSASLEVISSRPTALRTYRTVMSTAFGRPARNFGRKGGPCRNKTLTVLAVDPPANPADRSKNTVYNITDTDEKEVQAGFRIYVSDKGYDGTGWGPADTPSLEGPGVTYEGKLADGTRLSAEEVVTRFGRALGSAPPPLTVDEWYKLVDSKDNDPQLTPATAPARPDSQFEMFWGLKYTLAGAFHEAGRAGKD
jgi:hypothetical protein